MPDNFFAQIINLFFRCQREKLLTSKKIREELKKERVKTICVRHVGKEQKNFQLSYFSLVSFSALLVIRVVDL